MQPWLTPPTADLKAVENPNRDAKTPLVTKPEAIEFQGSSFPRRAANVQSKDENMAPQIPKLPKRNDERQIWAAVPFLRLFSEDTQ